MSEADLWTEKKTCRLCLIDNGRVCIFDEKTVLDKIMTYFKLKIVKNDGLPSLICTGCIYKVKDITKFITQCQENEKLLHGNLELRNGHDNNVVLSDNEIETVGNDNFANIDKQSDSGIPDKRDFKDDEKNLMDTIQISKDGEEFLYYKGIKIIVNREKSKETKIITNKIRSGLKQHATLCPICGKTILNTSLTEHMRLHGDKPHVCEICSKGFLWKSLLIDHMLIHNDVRDFACADCPKKFKTKNALRKHILGIHREPTTLHPCKLCDKIFKTNGRLKMHILIHTNEREYQCSICDRNFTYKSSLKCHMRTHTGEKPYPCKYCDKPFATSTSRIEHERLHTGEKPYKCPSCDKGFMQLPNMKSHFRNNHKGVEFKRKPLVKSFK